MNSDSNSTAAEADQSYSLSMYGEGGEFNENSTNFFEPSLSNFALTIDQFQNSYSFKILIIVTWSLLALFGIIGNGLVIFIAVKYKKLNDITNCYILALAISDLLFVLFCIPFTTFLYVDGYWTLGWILCKLFHYISHVSHTRERER